MGGVAQGCLRPGLCSRISVTHSLLSRFLLLVTLPNVVISINSGGDFQSRWRRRLTWLASSHNHIKITTKIENHHHSELSEIELNGSLTTRELKKPHPSRLAGGVETWNGLVPHPRVGEKIWEGYLGSEESQPR